MLELASKKAAALHASRSRGDNIEKLLMASVRTKFAKILSVLLNWSNVVPIHEVCSEVSSRIVVSD